MSRSLALDAVPHATPQCIAQGLAVSTISQNNCCPDLELRSMSMQENLAVCFDL